MTAPVVTYKETYRDDTWARGERWVDGRFDSNWIQLLRTAKADPEAREREQQEWRRRDDEYRERVRIIMEEHPGVGWWEACEILSSDPRWPHTERNGL